VRSNSLKNGPNREIETSTLFTVKIVLHLGRSGEQGGIGGQLYKTLGGIGNSPLYGWVFAKGLQNKAGKQRGVPLVRL